MPAFDDNGVHERLSSLTREVEALQAQVRANARAHQDVIKDIFCQIDFKIESGLDAKGADTSKSHDEKFADFDLRIDAIKSGLDLKLHTSNEIEDMLRTMIEEISSNIKKTVIDQIKNTEDRIFKAVQNLLSRYDASINRVIKDLKAEIDKDIRTTIANIEVVDPDMKPLEPIVDVCRVPVGFRWSLSAFWFFARHLRDLHAKLLHHEGSARSSLSAAPCGGKRLMIEDECYCYKEEDSAVKPVGSPYSAQLPRIEPDMDYDDSDADSMSDEQIEFLSRNAEHFLSDSPTDFSSSVRNHFVSSSSV